MQSLVECSCLWHFSNLIHCKGARLAEDAGHCQSMVLPTEFGHGPMVPDIVQR